jgi:O-antigen/teichoic acid export membrane protein
MATSSILRIIRDGASLAGTRLALIGVSFLSSIIVARALPLDERGRFGLLVAVGTLVVQFSNFGLPIANTYLASRHPDLLPSLVANTTRLFLVLVVVIIVFCTLGISLIPAWRTLWGGGVIMVCFLAIVSLAQMLTQNMLMGQLRFSVSNIVELVARVGSVVGMAVLWLVHGTTSYTFAFIAALFTGIATCWGLYAGKLQPTLKMFDRHLLIKQIFVGWRAYAACLASFVLGRLPLYAVESRGGLSGLAFFTQAMVVTDTMLVVPFALGTVIFPNLAATQEASTRIRSTLRLAGVTAGLMIVAVITAIWLGPAILPFVYGKAYASSMPVLLAMLPGVFALGLGSVMQNALSANGYPWITILSPFAGAVAVAIALQFTNTVVGCGWAYSIGATVMLCCSTIGWWFYRHDWVAIESKIN